MGFRDCSRGRCMESARGGIPSLRKVLGKVLAGEVAEGKVINNYRILRIQFCLFLVILTSFIQ